MEQQVADAGGVGEGVMAGGADAGDVPAPARRQRRRHRQHSLLPTRPKKPPTGYTMFLKHYFNTHPPQDGISARESLTRAGQQWRDLPEEQKQEFRHLCRGEQERYQNEMGVWNRQKTALKRPPSAYALFLKDFYERERVAGNEGVKGHVVEVGKRIKLEWENLEPERKLAYKVQNQNAQIAYRQRMTDIEEGNVAIEDLVNGVVRNDENNGGAQEENNYGENNNADDSDSDISDDDED